MQLDKEKKQLSNTAYEGKKNPKVEFSLKIYFPVHLVDKHLNR